MSELHVNIVTIDSVEPIEKADRLELARIAGWQCVIGKGQFKAGDKAIYVPIDSILPLELENKIFPPDSKVRLSKSRVKTIKLRGAISQGILLELSEYLPYAPEDWNIGEDVAGELGITKYEPPVKSIPANLRGPQKPRKGINPNFKKYTDIENFKHYNTLFAPGELVYVTEKLHGTSARYGWFETVPNTFWKKIKKFFGMLPRYEFCIGSRNVQLQDRKYDGFYDSNVYGKIAEKLALDDILEFGEAVFGEIVGPGIQKGYTYGHEDDHAFYAYDVMVDGEYLDPTDFVAFCDERSIPRVPHLFTGEYEEGFIKALATGDSTIGNQKVREGVVIKALHETKCMIGRKVLKLINDTYLLKEQDDFH